MVYLTLLMLVSTNVIVELTLLIIVFKNIVHLDLIKYLLY